MTTPAQEQQARWAVAWWVVQADRLLEADPDATRFTAEFTNGMRVRVMRDLVEVGR